MESINIVGGLKAEPWEIQYMLPPNGTSVEINVGDIYSDNDENEEEISAVKKDSGSGLSVSNMECVVIAEACEDEMEARRQMFNYVGYTKNDKTKKINLKEQETYNFNYTRNEDLLFYTDHFRFRRESEMTQENGQLKEEPRIESISDNEVDNEIKNDSEQNKIRNGSMVFKVESPECNDIPKKSCKMEIIESTSDNDINNEINSDSEQNDHLVDTNTNNSTTTVQNNKKRRRKQINLAEMVFKDDLSWKEYRDDKNGWYICKHCHHKDTLQNIKNHIIATHRKTETKQCPFCDVKTNVLAYHIRMYHKDIHWSPKRVESTPDNNVEKEIKSDSQQNKIRNGSTTTVQNNKKRRSRHINLAEAVFKVESPECNDIPKKSCKMEIIESTSDNDINNEINSDSEQNDHLVDTNTNNSTTTVQNNKKRRCKQINLAEMVFKDDLSWKEYRDDKNGWYICKHCHHKDTLQNIKNHIIATHRKTGTEQCPFCDVKTNVLAYHIRMYHKDIHWSPKRVESTPDNNVEKEIKSDSQQNKIRNGSTTTVQNIKKRRSRHINLAEAVFKDDLDSREYKDIADKVGGHISCYKCKHCNLRGTREDIKIHIIENHRKTEKKQCPFCNVKTHVLTYHLRVYHKNVLKNVHKCSECDYTAKSAQVLKMHIHKMHIINLTKCDKCEKIFTSKYHLSKHYSSHYPRNQRIYHCAHCDYSTQHKHNLPNHLQRHRDPQERPTLFCDQCDFRTESKTCFYRHRSNHNNAKLVCDQCGYTTGIPVALKLHIIGHKEKPDADDLRHHCDQCDYKTHRYYSLQVHKLKHLKPEEIEYFYCYHCNFKAKRKDNLKSHIWRLHLKKETLTLKCSICAFTTPKKHLLVQHVNKHSKNVYPL